MRNIAIFLHSSSPDSDSVPSISITFMRNCISYLNPLISISNKRNYDDLMRRIRCLCGNRTQDLVQEPKPNFIGREIAPSLRIILCYISEGSHYLRKLSRLLLCANGTFGTATKWTSYQLYFEQMKQCVLRAIVLCNTWKKLSSVAEGTRNHIWHLFIVWEIKYCRI